MKKSEFWQVDRYGKYTAILDTKNTQLILSIVKKYFKEVNNVEWYLQKDWSDSNLRVFKANGKHGLLTVDSGEMEILKYNYLRNIYLLSARDFLQLCKIEFGY